uniref:B30.2/SPRY domain-containing protein n=1 Tax=Vombatus ursinus TaxID=29139 RepID=A0A4X2JVH8_VOMUR
MESLFCQLRVQTIMDSPAQLCAKHREALKLLCQEDQKPICMVCHAIRVHATHHLFPVDEAVQDCLDIGNILHRAEMPMATYSKTVPPELRDRIQHLSGKSWILQRTMRRFTECLQSELEKRKVLLTLNPDTANSHLFISPDQKTVYFRETPQKLPYSAERFDSHFCVLAQEAFSSGKHCWEVCVGAGSVEGWAVGVSRASGRRKGEIGFVPSRGIWAIQMLKGHYEALTTPETPLTLSRPLKRLEVSLDYEGGSLTFSDAETGILIFTFSEDFCEEVLPFFWLWGQGAQLTVNP